MKKPTSINIMLICGCLLPLSLMCDGPVATDYFAKVPPLQGEPPKSFNEEIPLADRVLQAIEIILGLNDVTSNEHLNQVVNALETARGELLRGRDEKHVQAAQAIIEKAQNLPGSKTTVTPGVVDSHGHTIGFSMWRMLALARNGKNPIEAE